MFDLYGNDRLVAWKNFRDSLETSESPFEDTTIFWCHAPFVNQYLNLENPESWPDPWQLILDNKFDDLAITLAMLYTIKLTERFKNSTFEIRQVENSKKTFLVIDNDVVLNFEYRTVNTLDELKPLDSKGIWKI